MHKDTLIGILAALGISATAAIALPLVNVLTTLAPSELMMVRGLVTGAAVVLFMPRRILRIERNVILFATLFGMANLLLYMGIRTWGAAPTITILTTMPLVNIAAAWIRGERTNTRTSVALALLLFGVMLARNPWEATFNAVGFLESVAATLLAGLGVEVLSITKKSDPFNRTFWLAVVISTIGLLATLGQGITPFAHEVFTPLHTIQLIGFGLTAGFLYFLANIYAFDKLRTETACTLAMFETPAVIVSAWLVLGEQLSLIQWTGIIIASLATLGLSGAEAKASGTPEIESDTKVDNHNP